MTDKYSSLDSVSLDDKYSSLDSVDLNDTPPENPGFGQRLVTTAKALGQLVYDTPTNIAGYAANLDEGSRPLDKTNWADKAAAEQSQRLNERMGSPDANDPTFFPYMTKGKIAQAGPSFIFSAGGMGAALGAGGLATVATKGNLKAGYAAGALAAGGLAYRADSAMFMNNALDGFTKKYQADNDGTMPSRDMLLAEQERLQPFARDHGLVEAGFESAGSVIGGQLLKRAFKSGGSMLAKTGKAAAGLAVEEMPSETATDMVENNIEIDAGVHGGKKRSFASLDDIVQSAKDVAPAVAFQSALMGGGVAGARTAYDYATRIPVTEDELLTYKQGRLDLLNTKRAGTPPQSSYDANGTLVTVPGKDGEPLNRNELAEHDLLSNGSVKDIAGHYNFNVLTPEQVIGKNLEKDIKNSQFAQSTNSLARDSLDPARYYGNQQPYIPVSLDAERKAKLDELKAKRQIELDATASTGALGSSLAAAGVANTDSSQAEADINNNITADNLNPHASKYDSHFADAENKYKLPSGLLSTIGFHESGFDSSAVSKAGARGLMQFMPETAKEYGINPHDPLASIDAAGKKLSGLYHYYNGDLQKAIAAYNYGEGNLDKAIVRADKAGEHWTTAIPRETQNYLAKISGGQTGQSQSLDSGGGINQEQAARDAQIEADLKAIDEGTYQQPDLTTEQAKPEETNAGQAQSDLSSTDNRSPTELNAAPAMPDGSNASTTELAAANPLTQPENLNGREESTSESTSTHAEKEGLLSTDAPVTGASTQEVKNETAQLQTKIPASSNPPDPQAHGTDKPVPASVSVDEHVQREDKPAFVTAPLLNKSTGKPFKARRQAEMAIASPVYPEVNKQDNKVVEVGSGFGIAPIVQNGLAGSEALKVGDKVTNNMNHKHGAGTVVAIGNDNTHGDHAKVEWDNGGSLLARKDMFTKVGKSTPPTPATGAPSAVTTESKITGNQHLDKILNGINRDANKQKVGIDELRAYKVSKLKAQFPDEFNKASELIKTAKFRVIRHGDSFMSYMTIPEMKDTDFGDPHPGPKWSKSDAEWSTALKLIEDKLNKTTTQTTEPVKTPQESGDSSSNGQGNSEREKLYKTYKELQDIINPLLVPLHEEQAKNGRIGDARLDRHVARLEKELADAEQAWVDSGKPKNEVKFIGKNEDGDNIHEKPDGNRYIQHDNGLQENESVRIIPNRGGSASIVRNDRKDKFLTESELSEASQSAKQNTLIQAAQDLGKLDIVHVGDKKPVVSENTIYTKDAAEEARRILKSKLGQLNSGVDPEMFSAGITLAGYHIEKGARTFAAYSKEMIDDLGESIKPYLKQFYMGVMFDPKASSLTGMDSAADVQSFDIDSIKNEVAPQQQENGNGHRKEHNAGTTKNPTGNSSQTSDQSGISDEQQRQPNGSGAAPSNSGIRTGQGQHDSVDSTQGQGNGLSGHEGLAGHQANVGTQQAIGVQTGTDGSLPKSVGADNYSLIGKNPIALTPAKRRDVNILAEAILKKPVNEVTEDDKEILRQYTGNGGLDLKASVDKGEGIFNQHYSAYDTIKAMYGALLDAGVKMNNNLEPSVGSGNFIGMHPYANWTAVDIDKTNTEVVKRLYPDAQVFNESYETFRGKNFDLIISNVPFASFSSLAREHAGTIKPMFKAIHNFFFAQSIDKLKTVGVMAFMTSTGTMDGTGEGQRLRQHLIKQMDVIGAYRLPMGTQKANASTDVMIDVIFLQKRPVGVASKQPEKNQAFVDTANKDGYKINQYFVDYPESVLGDLSIGKNKTSMGKVGWIVTGDADYSRMKIIPQDYTSTDKRSDKSNDFSNHETAQAYADKHGYKFVDQQTTPFFKDGIVYDIPVTYNEQSGGGLFGRKATGVSADKLADLQKIDETHDAELVHQYEEKYSKPPHTDKLLALWAKTNHAAQQLKSYLALFDKHFNLSEIFTKQVRFKDSGKIEIDDHSPLLDRAESLEDADGIFNSKSNLVSASERQELLDNGDYAQLANGFLQNSRLYYAGNIYKKLDDAAKVKPAAQRDKQVAKLNRVKPPLIPINRLSITGKESWLPDSAIAAIGKRVYSDGTVIIGENAISDNHLLHLFNQYINNEALAKKGKDDTPEEYADRLKSAQNTLHNDVLPLIKQKIMDDGLADEVVDAYNKAKNFFAAPVFDGSSLRNLPETFKGKPFSLMQHQQEGAERAIYNKKGVLAFSPGLGKTPTAIIIADQLLQKGVMKKPLFIVPANTIPQWESSTRSLYPNAKVYEFPKYTSGINKGKPKEWPSMTKADKEKMVYDLTNNQYDFTFISTNLAQKFAIPAEKLSQYLDDLTESISSMEKPDDELNKSQIKAKETRLAKIRMLKATMTAAYAESTASGFDMGKMGFDALFADEVQYYKNIGMQSEDAKGGIGANVAINAKYPLDADGKPDKTQDPLSVTLGSSRSYDFRFKTQFISENNNGNNVFLLTGTPTPNKPLELMTLLHHLDTHILDEYGINNVGEFVDEFFDIQSVEEMGIDGSNKLKPQLVGIQNIFGLKKIISRYVDYRSPESAKDLTRPKQNDKVHIILQNEDAVEIFADVQARILQSIEDAKAKMSGDKNVVVEPMIKMYGAGRDGSIDVRLYSPSSDGKGSIEEGTVFQKETRAEYSKIAKTVELVAAKNKLDPEAGQLIFLDRLKFSDGSGSTHDDIRDDILKATGLKPQEVVFVNGGEYVNPNTGKVAKSIKPEMLQSIMDAYNDGRIKVLIGNTSKLGVGVDLQVTTTDIYQIDKPYRPDEIEQRNNRGVRQGNRNSEVTVHTFNQPGTFDAMSDRIIANKQGFNDVFWKDQDSDRADVKGEEAPGHYDAAIELEQDPLKKRKLEIERDLNQASSKTNHLEKQVSSLAKRIRTATETMQSYENANRGIDTRETPKYEDQKEAERKKSIVAFKKRQADQRVLNVGRIADIKTDLIELENNKDARVYELEDHKLYIADIRSRFIINGVVSLDAIAANPIQSSAESGDIKFSRSQSTKDISADEIGADISNSKAPAGLTGSDESPTLPFTGAKKGELTASDKSITQLSEKATHTPNTLRAAITKALDGVFGSGWANRLMATGKFKVISRDEGVQIAGKNAIDAKGFYDPKTDTTYIISDNISQDAKPSELVGLLLHEISTHALQLGKSNEAFQALLKRFEAMQKHNPKVKEAFARVPSDTKPEHIVEEALAYFLENNPDSTFKQRIIEAFRQLVRAIGNTLIGKDKFLFSNWANKLTETEILNMATSALRKAPDSLQFDNVGRENEAVKLAKNGKPLLAPNGKPSNLNAMQHAQVRTEAFKKWFGDWLYNPDMEMTPIELVDDPLMPELKDTAAIRRYLKGKFKAEKPVINAQTGNEISFFVGGIEAALKNRNTQSRRLFAILPEMLKQAAYAGYEENTKLDVKPNIKGYETYYAVASIDGKLNSVRIVVDLVKDEARGRGYYYHQISVIDLGGSVGKSRSQSNNSQTNYPEPSGRKIILSQLTGKVNNDASKVVDENGEPLVVYHGTQSNITQFMRGQGGYAYFTDAMDYASKFAGSYAGSNMLPVYLNLTKPIDLTEFKENPISKNTFEKKLNDNGVVTTSDYSDPTTAWRHIKSEGLKWDANGAGKDGFIFEEGNGARAYASFDPNQIKSATGNNGQFSTSNNDIRFSKKWQEEGQQYDIPENLSPTPAETPVTGNPFDNPKDVIKNLVGAEQRNLPHWDDVKSSLIQGFDKMGGKERKAMLGFLSLRNIADLSETVGILPILNKAYVPTIQKMVAAQNRISTEAGKLSETWLKLYTSNRAANDNLVNLMGDSTTAGIDGSKPWVSKITPDHIQEILDGNPGAETKRLVKLDKQRKLKHAQLKRDYDALPPAFRSMYDQVRDTYQRWFDQRYEALQARILDEEGTSTSKAQRIDTVRAVFESMQVDGPYFPLPRFGDYWVKSQDKDGNIYVTSEETLEQQTALKAEIKADGGTVLAEGVKPLELGTKGAVDADFVAKMDELVKTLGSTEAVNEVRDGMYQLYLSTLPSLSNRKHFLHRKNRLGWSKDMLRAFADIGLHEAKQYSRLKFGHKLQQIVSDMGSGIGMAENPVNRNKAEQKLVVLNEALDKSDSKGKEAIKGMIARLERRIAISKTARYHGDFEFARNIEGEVSQQFDNMMNPQTSSAAVIVNSIGFGWFLGGSVMSGVVNTMQNMLTINAAAAEFESTQGLAALPMVAKEFAIAAKDFMTNTHGGQVDIARGLKTTGERRAYVQFNQHELFDKTQGHDLSGTAQEGFKTGSFARYVTTKLGFFFHHAERFNRQVSAIAIYRAAVKTGSSHQAATDLAERLVWKTHYDYSAWNRARHLRGTTARIVMQFKQYGMSTAFLLGESWYKSVWKDGNIAPAERRKARAFFGGVMASQLLLAGAQGLPAGLATGMLAASALGARGVPFVKALNIGVGLTATAALALAMGLGDDDDDPEQFIDDPETWIKQWLADHAGKTWERIIMNGLVDALTPAGLSNRISMNGLLFRSPDKEMEGDAAWAAWAKTFLGPTAGGMTSDVFIGASQINQGEIWKGLEHMIPTAAKGVSKAVRGQVHGITNMAGNQLVKDLSTTESALQFLGDTPSRISEQYDLNNAEKNREARIGDRRKELLRDLNKAKASNDAEAMGEIRAEIKRFNAENNENKISHKNEAQSFKSKHRIEKKSEGGLYLRKGREYDF